MLVEADLVRPLSQRVVLVRNLTDWKAVLNLK